MKSYFENMPSFGKAVADKTKADVENINKIFQLEEEIHQALQTAKAAG